MPASAVKKLAEFPCSDRQLRRASARRRLLGPYSSTWLLCTLLFLVGCHAPAPPTGPSEIVLRIPDRDAFLDASLSVLRRHDFPPDRLDRSRGLIVSKPTTSGQWFEPWRADSRGAYQLFESSIHTMRREVAVSLEPLDGSGPDRAQGTPAPRFRLAVRVDKSRYSAPERQVTTASGALAIYSERLPTTEGLRTSESRDAHWVPLGRDPLLEAYLLERLVGALPDVEVAE